MHHDVERWRQAENQGAGVVISRGQRLLAEDIEPPARRQPHQIGMGLARGADIDDVEIFGCQHGFGAGIAARYAEGLGPGLSGIGGRIGNGDQLDSSAPVFARPAGDNR